MSILLGSDPELFVAKEGEFISAHGLIEGDKKHPHLVKCGAVQVDGMALEYNTNPAATVGEWEKNHVSVKRSLRYLLGGGYNIKATPTAFFSEEVFNSTPAEAKILGCEPDFNAYTQDINPAPNADVPFRTGAGHIHIGWTKDEDITDPFHLGECYALTKALDLFLGVPSVLMDNDVKRRELYGQAGAFRPKSYGLEYRVLSNFWTKSPKLRAWAFNNTIAGINWAKHSSGGVLYMNIINDNNLLQAKSYCRHNGVHFYE